MRIAQVAPLYESVPPKLYGGTERVVAYLCDALVDLGHEVTLFAAADADTRAVLAPMRDRAIRLDPAPWKSDLAAHMSMLDRLRQAQDRFDIIHFHTELLHFPMFEEVAGRTLTTLHLRMDAKDLGGAYRRWAKFPLVSISNAQRTYMPFANWAGTVYHGLAPDCCRFSPEPRGYLAFLGRMSREKRPDRAIEIAKALGMPLKMAAKIGVDDEIYFRTEIEPLLDHPLIEFVGEIDEAQKSDFLGGAEALLFPIDWPEPFGLVMIEAMACGTPVIAFDCGSAPEVVDHGVTGFVVRDVRGAMEAVRAARRLDRREIRKRFDRRFSAAAMARGYLDLYAERLARQPFAPEASAPSAKAPLVRIA
ncbi:glycosyltransferase family 4 protein [Phenylobacterium montanum]|uniref:Glycosyltransferase family 4 protein n=1 Tax=Phenylobacterium montanum TaxID=2823693 RepID=A0A975G138_9CAUL|nr:glycosyltransferase family 4 protein [Caulobacter sp. S6]QUD88821.1 glycosyltransferase family 4 protein [Caulobacter sp. S6]